MSKGKDSKPHIGIFGRRNSGKSSLINFLACQEISIVSEMAGTTTDPVKKSMEIFGIGPAILIDTAGIDDVGELGMKRVQKSMKILQAIDLAILVITGNRFGQPEIDLIGRFREFALPFFVIHNKSDLMPLSALMKNKIEKEYSTTVIDMNTLAGYDISEIVKCICKYMPDTAYHSQSLLGDVISSGDTVLLVTPIDLEAPEGRMILPQVQMIRDVLDNDAVNVVLKETALESYIRKMNPKPVLVITDSQAFAKVNAVVPADIALTSFSIVMARSKGDFLHYQQGTPYLSKLKDGDRLLILESCTHEVNCDDIGRVKIPRWIRQFSGKKLEFDVVGGLNSLPRDIHEYAMVVQCGGCTLTHRQLINRLKPAVDAGIPVSNYGMAIAYINGIYQRAIAPFVKAEAEKVPQE
ncbi:MAG: [FeFe] hydrogenase H-cluster maturation GTPase HydF [Bacteroidota bacterium]|nr:[FeFe] hydrogenase H-cluster maturation GTPase HydF [Bacteroidota bacterium]